VPSCRHAVHPEVAQRVQPWNTYCRTHAGSLLSAQGHSHRAVGQDQP